MDLYKDKEISDTVTSLIDPNDGIQITDGIQADEFQADISIKAKTLKKNKEKTTHSDLQEIDAIYKHPIEDIQDFMTINGQGEVAYELIPIEELIEYLDNTERELDV